MKTLLINGSPRKDGNTAVALNEIAYEREKGEAAQDTEGMQTMRTLARNMAWLLKNLAAGAIPRPEGESWQPMHFIR